MAPYGLPSANGATIAAVNWLQNGIIHQDNDAGQREAWLPPGQPDGQTPTTWRLLLATAIPPGLWTSTNLDIAEDM